MEYLSTHTSWIIVPTLFKQHQHANSADSFVRSEIRIFVRSKSVRRELRGNTSKKVGMYCTSSAPYLIRIDLRNKVWTQTSALSNNI